MSTAKKIDVHTAFQEFGTVTHVHGHDLRVRTAHGEYAARRAVSCLVAPVENDRVLVAADESGEAFVLAVVSRGGEAATRLTVAGDLELSAPTGKIAMIAAEGVELLTPKDVSIASQGLSVHTRIGRLVVEQLTYAGSKITAEVEHAKTVVGAVETTVERLVERVRDAYRFVSETAQLRAKRIDYVASDMARVHAKDTVVTADGLVKVDGDQIHLG